MALTFTEENYLKAIYLLINEGTGKITNLSIAERLDINPATVTEMLRKLTEKEYIHYNRAEGASLTETGNTAALKVIRKHRLWETFLVEKMEFSWNEVHELAEQLEHIQSDKLMEQLDKLLDYPKFDPHGDPIPDETGEMPDTKTVQLSECRLNKTYRLAGVANHSAVFLQYLDKIGLTIGNTVEIKEIQDFDKSMAVLINGRDRVFLSADVNRNLLVR